MALHAIPLPDQGDIATQCPDYMACLAPDCDQSDHHRTLEEMGWEFVYYQIVDDQPQAQPWFERLAAEEYIDYQMGLDNHGPRASDWSRSEELSMNFIDHPMGADHRRPSEGLVSEEVCAEYIDYQMAVNNPRILRAPQLILCHQAE